MGPGSDGAPLPGSAAPPSAPAEPASPDRRPRAGQVRCPQCHEGADRDRYFCRNGHRLRSEDRSVPVPPRRPASPRRFSARVLDQIGPDLSPRTRAVRLGSLALVAGLATALLVPPWGPEVRGLVGRGADTALGRTAPAVDGISAAASEAAPGLGAPYAVDGSDTTSWGVPWRGPAPAGDPRAACGTRAPAGTPELVVTFEPVRVTGIEIRTGVDPDLAGADQQEAPTRLAVRLGDGNCAVVTFDEPGPGTRSLSFDGPDEVGLVAVRVLDAPPGAAFVAVREVVVRR